MAFAGEENSSVFGDVMLPWPSDYVSEYVRDDSYEFEAPKWLDFDRLDSYVFKDDWFCGSRCKHPNSAYRSDTVLKPKRVLSGSFYKESCRRSANSPSASGGSPATPPQERTPSFCHLRNQMETLSVCKTSPCGLKFQGSALKGPRMQASSGNKPVSRSSKLDLHSENRNPNKAMSFSSDAKCHKKPASLGRVKRASGTTKVVPQQDTYPKDDYLALLYEERNRDREDDRKDAKDARSRRTLQDCLYTDAANTVITDSFCSSKNAFSSGIEEIAVIERGPYEGYVYYPTAGKAFIEDSGPNTPIQNSKITKKFREFLGDLNNEEPVSAKIRKNGDLPRSNSVCFQPNRVPTNDQKSPNVSKLKYSSSTKRLWRRMKSYRSLEKVSSICSSMKLSFHNQKTLFRFETEHKQPKTKVKTNSDRWRDDTFIRGGMKEEERRLPGQLKEGIEDKQASLEFEQAGVEIFGNNYAKEEKKQKNSESQTRATLVPTFKTAKWRKAKTNAKEQKRQDDNADDPTNSMAHKKFNLAAIFKPRRWGK